LFKSDTKSIPSEKECLLATSCDLPFSISDRSLVKLVCKVCKWLVSASCSINDWLKLIELSLIPTKNCLSFNI